jgi:death on curing protein
VTGHALADDNKRLGWLATTVFLSVNRETFDLGDENAFRLVVDVAEGS